VNITDASFSFGIFDLAVTAFVLFFCFYFFKNLGITMIFKVFFNIFLRVFETVTNQIIILKLILFRCDWAKCDHFLFHSDKAGDETREMRQHFPVDSPATC
jgi:hypothetical protein